MAVNYTIVAEFFASEPWFLALEATALRNCVQSNRYNMIAFVEIFWYGLPTFNFDVYMIVRETINIVR